MHFVIGQADCCSACITVTALQIVMYQNQKQKIDILQVRMDCSCVRLLAVLGALVFLYSFCKGKEEETGNWKRILKGKASFIISWLGRSKGKRR